MNTQVDQKIQKVESVKRTEGRGLSQIEHFGLGADTEIK